MSKWRKSEKREERSWGNVIRYLHGDATNPAGKDNRIVCHVCNDIGGWGRGFVLSLSNKWSTPENEYRKWSKGKSDYTNEPFELGSVQFVQVEYNLWIANMIAQHDVVRVNGVPPIRYEALEQCLEKVADKAKELGASIHGPQFGAGLAQGNWQDIEKLIEKTCGGLEVTIYLWK